MRVVTRVSFKATSTRLDGLPGLQNVTRSKHYAGFEPRPSNAFQKLESQMRAHNCKHVLNVIIIFGWKNVERSKISLKKNEKRYYNLYIKICFQLQLLRVKVGSRIFIPDPANLGKSGSATL